MKREISTDPSGVLFADDSGAKLSIFPVHGYPGTVAIDTDPEGGGDVSYIRAHELAEVVAALYEAAGQPVPDLPVIHDQAEVERLATLIYQITYGQSTNGVRETSERVARGLLAHGVRLPEATP